MPSDSAFCTIRSYASSATVSPARGTAEVPAVSDRAGARSLGGGCAEKRHRARARREHHCYTCVKVSRRARADGVDGPVHQRLVMPGGGCARVAHVLRGVQVCAKCGRVFLIPVTNFGTDTHLRETEPSGGLKSERAGVGAGGVVTVRDGAGERGLARQHWCPCRQPAPAGRGRGRTGARGGRSAPQGGRKAGKSLGSPCTALPFAP